MRRKSDRVKKPVAASPDKRTSRRSKRSASDTEEKPQNSDNEQSEQNSGSEQDSDHQPVAKSRRKLSRNTKVTNEEKPVRSRRGRPAKNIETVAEEDEEADSAQQSTVTTEENSTGTEKERSPSPEPVKTESPEPANAKSPEPEPVKLKTPEPEKVKSPEPTKVKSPEPSKVKSPEPSKVKSPEPPKVTSPEPQKVKSPEPITLTSPAKEISKEATPEPAPVVEVVPSSEPVVVETKINSESADCLTDKTKQTEQSNGSSEAVEQTEETSSEENRGKSKAKEQPSGRRRHRKPSTDNAEVQSPEIVRESPRKRRNRFDSPANEPDNQIKKDEVDETSKVVEETPTNDVITPIKSKSSESDVVKDTDKSQECDGRKSSGEKENKEKRKSDERTVSSEKKQKPVRKRKWLTQKSTEPKPQILAISTDSLKNLISDVKPVPLSDVKLESSPEPEEVQIVSKNDTAKSNTTSTDSRDRSHRNKEHRNESKPDKKHDENTSMASNRKISIVSDDTTTVQRPPSPPKFSSSNILFITNLVRPFTVLQLKGLLARTGKIVDDGFWIDKIKSKCYVKYETEDEAIETRHALHGVRWPASNPKCLNVDFGSEKSMDKAIASTTEQPPSKEGVAAAREERVSGGWDRFEVDERKEPAATTRPMREWDVGKKEDLGREREKERERDRGDRNRDRDREHPKESREVDRQERRKRTPDISHSVSPPRKFHKKENEPPIRLLDDLFRKTKTTPCVYWLPLTSEQIALKEEERRKQQAEQKRRIEQREKERNERNERDRERERNRGDRDRRDDRDRDRRRY